MTNSSHDNEMFVYGEGSHDAYKDGFHIILIEDPDAGPNEMKFQLKCPSCSHIYDLNLYCSIKK